MGIIGYCHLDDLVGFRDIYKGKKNVAATGKELSGWKKNKKPIAAGAFGELYRWRKSNDSILIKQYHNQGDMHYFEIYMHAVCYCSVRYEFMIREQIRYKIDRTPYIPEPLFITKVNGKNALAVREVRKAIQLDQAMSIATKQQKRQYIMQVALLLHSLQHARFMHRDVHPGNILVDADNRVALVDFGYSRIISEDIEKSQKNRNVIFDKSTFNGKYEYNKSMDIAMFLLSLDQARLIDNLPKVKSLAVRLAREIKPITGIEIPDESAHYWATNEFHDPRVYKMEHKHLNPKQFLDYLAE